MECERDRSFTAVLLALAASANGQATCGDADGAGMNEDADDLTFQDPKLMRLRSLSPSDSEEEGGVSNKVL